MWPDRVSNPGPLTYESGALPTALRGPANGGLLLQKKNLLLQKHMLSFKGRYPCWNGVLIQNPV